eukprot:4025397-Pleurochrysis_carterae.AAC.1
MLSSNGVQASHGEQGGSDGDGHGGGGGGRGGGGGGGSGGSSCLGRGGINLKAEIDALLAANPS